MIVKELTTEERAKAMQLDMDRLVNEEIQRISSYLNGKAYMTAEDLAKVLNVGEANARGLMKCSDFPLVVLNRRQIINISNFVMWMFSHKISHTTEKEVTIDEQEDKDI